MNKTFKKTLIAATVGAVLASASMFAQAGGGSPATTNLLFPFISTKDSAVTFLSIVARDTTGAVAVGTAAPVHITYVTRPIGTGVCSHYDGDMAMTYNDQLTFEVSNRSAVNTLTGDTTSTPVQLPANANNRVGYAIVNNSSLGSYGTGAPYKNLPLYGQARVIDTATGLYWGYSTNDLHTLDAGDPDFAVATGEGPDANAAGVYANKVLSWFATSAVTTTWLIEPLATETAMAFTAAGVTIGYQVSNSNGVAGGHYNNNEVFRSSTATVVSNCLNTITRDTLLDPMVGTHSTNGGWGTFIKKTVTGTGVVNAANGLVYTLEVLQPGVLGGLGQFVTRTPVF